ncbi:MAG: DUF5666 domain-containing protein [Candidatus Aminicenantes bacterium]|nr:DUF5666 domain-containing protein [Candidatus Aminicenantes bacterium]
MKKTLVLSLVFLAVVSMLTASSGVTITRIEGLITAIDSANLQIIVGTTAVQVTPTTIIRIKDIPITFADLKLGMTVRVCGIFDGNVLKAHTITVKYLGK